MKKRSLKCDVTVVVGLRTKIKLWTAPTLGTCSSYGSVQHVRTHSHLVRIQRILFTVWVGAMS